MNDETKDELMRRTREWLQSCVNAATRSGVPEEADLEAFILAHIDGEPARQQAACDRRAEEVREADANFIDRNLGGPIGATIVAGIRSLPLTASPLGDELRDEREVSQSLREQLIAAEAERDALRAENDRLRTWVSTVSEALGAIEPVSDCRVEMIAEASAKVAESLRAALERANEGVRYWTDLAQAEARDAAALRARVAELEADVNAWRDTPARILYDNQRNRAERAEAQAAAAHERLDEFGMRRDGTTATLVEGIDAMRERIDEYRAEWYTAEAQVAAARAECARIHDVHPMEDAYTAATSVLRAMDEAAKK